MSSTNAQRAPETGQIAEGLSLLHEDRDVIEIRAFNTKGYATNRYFTNTDDAAEHAAKEERQGRNVYQTLNALPADLAYREGDGTKDKEVKRRRWLMVDADPIRPAGISATNAEREQARAIAREIVAYSRDRRWPEPHVFDSGNGLHLMFPIDLANDAEAQGLVKGALEGLMLRFGTEGVKVDTSVHNASRVTRVYGTMNRKGKDADPRPHRRSGLLSRGQGHAGGVVDPEQLRGLAPGNLAKPPKSPPPGLNGSGRRKPLDVGAWLEEHGVAVKKSGPYDGGHKWILEECPEQGHTDNSAYIIQFAGGGISAGCSHDSCKGGRGDNAWHEWREHYEPGWYDRADITVGGKSPSGRTESPEPVAWPELDGAAHQGLPGDVVRTFEPHTEADAVAVLANLLCAFGNVIGRGAFARVGSTEHHPKLFAGLVGETAKGRKGESWGPVRRLMEDVDPGWASGRIMGGLSSGEGLIYHVRDEVRGERKGEEVVLDPGEPDKRLLAMEGELASLLKVMTREGNTLSPTIRQAWDGDRLRTMTKNSPTRATGAHISIIGHVTKAELLRHLSDTEAANGFANRFLWLMVRRSKELPFGGDVPHEDLKALGQRLDSAVRFARKPRPVRWGVSARGPWAEVYGPLSEGKAGLFGAVVGRAEAQTLRLAALYAAMNESETIEYEHLSAALALWSYAEESARYIFGDATGDPVADDITEALRAAGDEGLSRTEIRDLFGRHKSADRINQALGLLLKLGRAAKEQQQTGGRPTERWYAA